MDKLEKVQEKINLRIKLINVLEDIKSSFLDDLEFIKLTDSDIMKYKNEIQELEFIKNLINKYIA